MKKRHLKQVNLNTLYKKVDNKMQEWPLDSQIWILAVRVIRQKVREPIANPEYNGADKGALKWPPQLECCRKIEMSSGNFPVNSILFPSSRKSVQILAALNNWRCSSPSAEIQ
jgi:hypothetical protein